MEHIAEGYIGNNNDFYWCLDEDGTLRFEKQSDTAAIEPMPLSQMPWDFFRNKIMLIVAPKDCDRNLVESMMKRYENLVAVNFAEKKVQG